MTTQRLRQAALDLLRAGDAVHAVRHLPLRADDLDLHPVVPGADRRRSSFRCAASRSPGSTRSSARRGPATSAARSRARCRWR